MARKYNMNLKDTINYFCSNVNVIGGCWKNKTYKNYNNGYLQTWFNKKHESLARLILIERHGREFMKNYITLHSCNNSWCINPNHLSYGTPQENSDDMKRANRQAKGNKITSSKLTDLKVKVIKSLLSQNRLTQKEIAELFKVSNGTISYIKKGKIWSHITNE